MLTPWKKSYDQLDSIFKSRDIALPTKIRLVKARSSGHVWMWELDCEESWAPKNWCFWTVVLEKTFRVPQTARRSLVNPKGYQSWIFIGRTDVEAETPIFWPPDVKSWLTGKDHDAGKDWRQEEKGTTEDEMVGWHHWLNGHEFEQAPRVFGDGQGSLKCWSPMGSQRVRHDWVTKLNWTEHLFMPNRLMKCWIYVWYISTETETEKWLK